MEVTNYREKVFDNDTLDFCMNIVDFVERHSSDSAFLRRALLDAMVFTKSLKDLNRYVYSLSGLPLHVQSEKAALLDCLNSLGSEPELLQDFLTTLRALNTSNFNANIWSGFLRTVQNIQSKQLVLADYFMTLRHLLSIADTFVWEDFFHSMDVLSDKSEQLKDHLMTVRHLAQIEKFSEWSYFFKSIRILGHKKESVTEHLMTIRHLTTVAHFNEWADFFVSVGVLSEKFSELNGYFMTIRHLSALSSSFSSWVDFFRWIKCMESCGISIFQKNLEAIRHLTNYLKKEESWRGVFRALAESPESTDAFAYGQLDSKQWLIDEAQKVWKDSWGVVFVLAGWIGLLPRFIFDSEISVEKIRSFDIDIKANKTAELLNQMDVQKDWRFKSSTMDITQLTYPASYKVLRKDGTDCEMYELPSTIINTSCEHIKDFESWFSQIPMGTRVILQTNNGFHIPEHVSCFKTLKDFEKAVPLAKTLYRGEKSLPEFNRFMLIGIK